jgi:hypothetical protein
LLQSQDSDNVLIFDVGNVGSESEDKPFLLLDITEMTLHFEKRSREG